MIIKTNAVECGAVLCAHFGVLLQLFVIISIENDYHEKRMAVPRSPVYPCRCPSPRIHDHIDRES